VSHVVLLNNKCVKEPELNNSLRLTMDVVLAKPMLLVSFFF
jgi:hypothetical protein